MPKIVNFKPTRDELAGLKDDLTFTFTELGPFEPNSAVPLIEGIKYRNLSDLEVQKAASTDQTLYIDANPSAPTQPATIEGNIPVATQTQAIEEFQRINPIRVGVRSSLSFLIGIGYRVGDSFNLMKCNIKRSIKWQ